MRLAHNLIHRMCVKLAKSFRAIAGFSTAAPCSMAALFLSIEKNPFKIKGLAWSQSACSQSYPHFMCGTATAVENGYFLPDSGWKKRPFSSLPHFYAGR
ncbi:hypothetical protein [Janthinobacterium sp. 1_2014MBL_MicDiv]|uniref:hypothetical protein n=1 Tax=Janthinobacterium sp. 1_2014MBL_MicDiv TaxID=1644131 RepID=UPI0012EBAFCD|nr:hypothetical protein [Janthinobacterium sp. 1_2014MBL_MicDiv]